MKPQPEDTNRDRGKTGHWKLAGLALLLGAGTWLLSNILLPARLPDGFPKLPDVQALNPGLRSLLVQTDKEARAHPRSAVAIGKLGMAYHSNQYYAEAAAAYRIASQLAPGDDRWVYCQALLQGENGNEKEEFDLLRQTVRLKPGHVPALLKLADGYFKQAKLDEAARDYELAAKAAGGPLPLQATFGLGRVAAERHDWNKVIEYAAPLSRSYPSVRPPFQLLQNAYEALGQADKAAEVRESILLGKFTVLPPPDDETNDRLVELCYTSTRLLKQAGLLSRFGKPDQALRLARRAAEADPKDPDIRDFIARTLVTVYPDKPEAVDEALTQLGECLRLKPDNLAPLWAFSSAFFESPKTPAAVERLYGMLRPHAASADSHFYLGLVADARGDILQAVSQYQEALKNNPDNSGVYNKLGLVFERTGKFDAATGYLQKAVQLDPMNTVARFNLGVVLMQTGNYSRGLKELAEELKLKPHDAATYFCMGFAYLYSKRIDEAVASFREGLRYQQDDAEAHFGLGSALSMRNKKPEAVAELRRALSLRPNYPEARDLLYQLER